MPRKILLIVDLQKDFIDGSLAVKNASDIIPVINSVKRQFDKVYFTLDWHPSDHCSFKENGGKWPSHCVHYTQGAGLPEMILENLDEKNTRFILKGKNSHKEEYGAFSEVPEDEVDLFKKGDVVVVCGIAAEYCVLETLKNLFEKSKSVGFAVRVFLEGTAKFSTFESLRKYMNDNNIELWE